jgi:hypothetical protein
MPADCLRLYKGLKPSRLSDAAFLVTCAHCKFDLCITSLGFAEIMIEETKHGVYVIIPSNCTANYTRMKRGWMTQNTRVQR